MRCLRKAVAELTLDRLILKEAAEGNPKAAMSIDIAVTGVVGRGRFDVSERRGCTASLLTG